MISYNPKDWFGFLFRFHKVDTVRQLFPLIIGICIYSGLIAYLEIHYFKLPDNSYLKNLPTMHSLLGFVLSMLLVFRTNSAYDRWWEGRKLWGSLTNNSRNFAIKLSTILQEKADRDFFRRIIPAYAYTLSGHLKSEETRTALFKEDKHFLASHKIDTSRHVPNQVAALMYKRIQRLYETKVIDGNQLIILNAEWQSFTDACGACERIKNTPIPFSYSAFIKKFIFAYIITLPIGFVFTLGYWVIPVVAFIFYVLASLELIAEEIEDPFGDDENDVPTAKIADNIHKHIEEIFEY